MNNREAGDLRRHRAHYNVIKMILLEDHVCTIHSFIFKRLPVIQQHPPVTVIAVEDWFINSYDPKLMGNAFNLTDVTLTVTDTGARKHLTSFIKRIVQFIILSPSLGYLFIILLHTVHVYVAHQISFITQGHHRTNHISKQQSAHLVWR